MIVAAMKELRSLKQEDSCRDSRRHLSNQQQLKEEFITRTRTKAADGMEENLSKDKRRKMKIRAMLLNKQLGCPIPILLGLELDYI
ncbi:hypothetical protein HPP92_004881 [Vanilla planifolia]|uniref:Uncharacterized protein n=1 Tax=Vanilla planifolia TaxID=51239 RepID=A0A835RXJ1_VANPL|nr:hypothetical protein HPP92_004881 [Vanilla planifolia]